MEKLAIHGGQPIRSKLFPGYTTLGPEEEAVVSEVIRDGVISDFIGVKGEFFNGGARVKQLESLYQDHAGTKHAISMNSATSVIISAMAAFGVGPGDEVLVTPYSHVISATAPLLFDAIPVFVDSEDDFYCMSVEDIERKITPRTKAMIIVDLFGMSADMERIMALADKHEIYVLSDSAHIIKARYKGRLGGTLAHIGSYSLNGHKVIQCGEGGIAVTNDDDLAFRMQLMRNHAENCVAAYEVADITNLIGYNFRMTELEAAVAIEQFKKMDYFVDSRRRLCEYLTEGLKDVEGLGTPKMRADCEHDYMIYPLRYDPDVIGISREGFMSRLDAEGIRMAADDARHVPPISQFVKPIHLQPIFQKKQYRPHGYPWAAPEYDGDVTYEKGICPVVEDLYERSLISINAIYPPLTTDDMDDIISAIKKVVTLTRIEKGSA